MDHQVDERKNIEKASALVLTALPSQIQIHELAYNNLLLKRMLNVIDKLNEHYYEFPAEENSYKRYLYSRMPNQLDNCIVNLPFG